MIWTLSLCADHGSRHVGGLNGRAHDRGSVEISVDIKTEVRRLKLRPYRVVDLNLNGSRLGHAKSAVVSWQV